MLRRRRSMYISSDSFISVFPLNLVEAIAGMSYTTPFLVILLLYKEPKTANSLPSILQERIWLELSSTTFP